MVQRRAFDVFKKHVLFAALNISTTRASLGTTEKGGGRETERGLFLF